MKRLKLFSSQGVVALAILVQLTWLPASIMAQDVFANVFRKAGDMVTFQVSEGQKYSVSTENAADYLSGVYYGPQVDFGNNKVFTSRLNTIDPVPAGSSLTQELNGHRYVLSGGGSTGNTLTITDYVISTGQVNATIATGITNEATALTLVPEKHMFVLTVNDGGTAARVDVELAPFAYTRDASQANVVSITKVDGTVFSSNVDQLSVLRFSERPTVRDDNVLSYTGNPVWFGESYYFKRRQSVNPPSMSSATATAAVGATTYTLASNGTITFGNYSISTGIANASKLLIDAENRRFVVANSTGTCYDIVFGDNYFYNPRVNTSNADAYAVANADWGWSAAGGVQYGKASFVSLFGNAQTISVAKYPESSVTTSIYDEEGSSKGTDDLALEASATAAVNGSYFNMSSFRSETALWLNGTEVATTTSAHAGRCTGLVRIKNGILSLQQYTASSTDLATLATQYDALLASGPLLRFGGATMTNVVTGNSSFDGVNPRTILGKTADGTVYMIVVDGRKANVAVGTTIEQTALLAEYFGLIDAINLDGGGSTTLWVNGPGVINTPSDGPVRKVPNIIIAK